MGETVQLFDDASAERLKEAVRIAEAMLFAAAEPLAEGDIEARLPPQASVALVLDRLRQHYAHRGVVLVRREGSWAFRTAPDLGWLFSREILLRKKLSRAATETLAIIAYHQPVTRAEIEDVRGVALSKGILDVLLEAGWVRLRGRRKSPGRPLTYGTTSGFLDHFGLEGIGDLPKLDDLQAMGLLSARLPKGFSIPAPDDDVALGPDEGPLQGEDAFPLEDEDASSDEDRTRYNP